MPRQPAAEQLPEGCERWLGEVHYLSKGTEPCTIDIVFCHGIQLSEPDQAWWKTWKSAGGTFWPAALAEEIPGARILSISYDGAAFRNSVAGGVMDPEQTAKAVYNCLVESAEVGQARPVVFFAHSLGGLIVMLLLNEAKRRVVYDPQDCVAAEKLLQHTKMIFFAAVPFEGSEVAQLAGRLPIVAPSPFLKMLMMRQQTRSNIVNQFKYIMHESQYKIEYRAVGESLDTQHAGFHKLVVDATSARGPIRGSNFYVVPRTNHYTIAAPDNPTQQAYIRQFIAKTRAYAALPQAA